MSSPGRKQASLGPSGGWAVSGAVLVGTGGGRSAGDNQSGCGSNGQRGGGVCVLGVLSEPEGKTGFCCVLVRGGKAKSSSKVTHWRGARASGREEVGASGREEEAASGREEGGAKGRAGAGHGSGRSRGAHRG